MVTTLERPRPAAADDKAASIPCPVCDATDYRPIRALRDNRTGAFDQSFTVARCLGCGLIGLRPQPDQDELFSGYERGYGPYPEAQADGHARPQTLRETVEQRLRHAWHVVDGNATIDRVRASGRVLDVGCGPGDNVAVLRRLGFDAVGIDPNPNVVRIGQERGLPIAHGTLETIEVVPESFDTVILSQVVEHLIDPVGSLATIHRLLRPGGRVILFTPNVEGLPARLFGDDWGHWHLPYHVYIYGPGQLRSLLGRAGFGIERLSTTTPGYWLYLSVVLRRHLSQATGWSFDKTGRRNFRLPARLAVAPLARAVDAAGRGDCLIAVGRKA